MLHNGLFRREATLHLRTHCDLWDLTALVMWIARQTHSLTSKRQVLRVTRKTASVHYCLPEPLLHTYLIYSVLSWCSSIQKPSCLYPYQRESVFLSIVVPCCMAKRSEKFNFGRRQAHAWDEHDCDTWMGSHLLVAPPVWLSLASLWKWVISRVNHSLSEKSIKPFCVASNVSTCGSYCSNAAHGHSSYHGYTSLSFLSF